MNKSMDYMVSVRLMAYNHGEYIAQAIQSILDQVVNFKVELVIGDDFSSDNTLEVAKSFESTDNVSIKVLDRQVGDSYWTKRQKLGRLYNFSNTIENCSGKYVALLDGDDYWIDPYKLQTQVDFMEANPEYSFSMGRVNMLIEETGAIKKRNEDVNPSVSEKYTLTDYLKKPFSQTSSFFFKNSTEPFPDWFYKVHAGDQSCVVIKTADGGLIKYHDKTFSVYRVNEKSISHQASFNVYEKFIDTLDYWKSHLNKSYSQILTINQKKYKQKSHFQLCKTKLCKAYHLLRVKLLEMRIRNLALLILICLLYTK
ncbi:glycosyltransferase family 2 protein [Owenweeksia hongkongensis]|uniref:glycosyltransferase family 2 protein n=1 Tax=Owenweeksia hongkongensis TaxID=253245 RepID=UPI003A8EE243